MTEEIIYVLTRGEYSDYSILGVETDLKRARRIQKLMTGDGYGDQVDIEEWVVGDFGDANRLTDERLYFTVYLASPHHYLFWNKRWINNLVVEKVDSTRIKREEVNDVYHSDRLEEYYAVTVEARDHEHAAKIGGDLIAAFKAREAGV